MPKPTKQIRWSVTQKYISSEKNLDNKVIELINYLIDLEIKTSLLTENKELAKLTEDILDLDLEHLSEFENCYAITPKIEIILGKIPIMN